MTISSKMIRSIFLFSCPLLLSLSVITITGVEYVPPDALIQALSPTGIRISIPDQEGISLVAYHAKVNEDFYSLEAGTISVDIIKSKNGRWIYEDRKTRLKKGDIVYLWCHVVYNNIGYNKLSQIYEVTEFFNYDGTRIQDNSDQLQTCLGSATRLYDENGVSHSPCAGQIIFEDEYRSLDRFNQQGYTVVEKFPSGKEYNFALYRNSILNINIKKDFLTIRPTLNGAEFGDSFIREGYLSLDRCTGITGTPDCHHQAKGWNIIPPVASGRINTKRTLNFEYGRIIIRAKLPRGDWIYPLMILEPAKPINAMSPTEPQLRIATANGNVQLKTKLGVDISNHILWGGAIGFDSRPASDYLQSSRVILYNETLWSEEFHIFEMIWSINKLQLKVDGLKYFEEELMNVPRNTPFFLTLGVGVGGVTEFPDESMSGGQPKPWGNTEAKALYRFYSETNSWSKTWTEENSALKIDYVKVYAL